ncbi:hypothetical protein LX87_04110 [Larkinella arboricola]|uniref:Uncharacterized protein n=1 Tax=Larkinella arboricola TaxID=643671 RepID=A0A327WXH7_LARAB|nr:hypothetical protein [Larkinella arboricola]RAJ94225.1 hypothetical protein LX87_04110 [Larkinella arboricola]
MKNERLIWRDRRNSLGNDLGYLVGMVIILGRSIRKRMKFSTTRKNKA